MREDEHYTGHKTGSSCEELLPLAVYYQPTIDTSSLELMRLIVEEYTKACLYGSRKIAAVFRKKGI